MKILLIVILMNMSDWDIGKIARVNSIKKQAAEAYRMEDYDTAIAGFRLLTDSLGVEEDPVLLNLANAYYHQNDTTNAQRCYARLLTSPDDEIRSLAYQQSGAINMQKNKMPQALQDFKASLKANPANDDARYNYELLKKMMKEQEQQQQDDKNIEPSEYAKKLKEQADKLVQNNQFEQALHIMQMGLQEDETVAAYNQFISKLGEVVESKE